MMKFFLLSLTVFALLCSCNQELTDENNTSEETKTTLHQIIDQWHEDAARGDHEAYIGAMSEDGIYIGTDATENWTTAAFKAWSKPYFDKGRSWRFHVLERNIYIDDEGIIAWFDELLDTKLGLCRGSGVLSKRKDQWHIKHYVLSATIPNEMIYEVVEMKQRTDSLLMLELRQANNK